MVYCDLTDVIDFARYHTYVSGIQRVVCNLGSGLQEGAKVTFFYFNQSVKKYFTIDGVEFDVNGSIRNFNRLNGIWQIGKLKWSYTRNEYRSRRGIHKIKPIVRYIKSRIIRPFMGKRHKVSSMILNELDSASIGAGDVILIPHIIQYPKFYERLLSSCKDAKIVFFVHDIIPAVTPEFCAEQEANNFIDYLKIIYKHADLILTSAVYNIGDLKCYANEHLGGSFKCPIESIPLPADLSCSSRSVVPLHEISPIARRLSHYSYCLVVGSVGLRKNHIEMLFAWRKYYESENYNNQMLVVAGEQWDGNADVRDLLNSHFADGSVIYFRAPSDAELLYLYQHCKFTINISLYEGWGLPVSESIALGKPVIVSNDTTLPEAGYGLAEVVPARDLRSLVESINRMFNNKEYYDAQIKKIRAEQNKLPTWQDFTNSVVDAINRLYN